MNKYNFDLVDKYKPELVVKRIIDLIEKDTQGYVKGTVANYSGHISSYKVNTGYVVNLQAVLGSSKDVDIQEDLGELKKKDEKFEVYLTVKGLEDYKYRMMFFKHGIISYPVMIVLNEDLARNCFDNALPAAFLVKNMNELEETLQTLTNSKYFMELVQSLINEALRREHYQVEEEIKPPQPIGRVEE